MLRWDPLNERQMDVLRRIGDGQNLSPPEDVGFRTSARALQSRGLVQVSRRDGGWQAVLTDAGEFYLQRGRHPEHPALEQQNSPVLMRIPSTQHVPATPVISSHARTRT